MQRFLALLALAATALIAQPATGSKEPKGIQAQIRGLRSLPDDIRAVNTRQIAKEIRALPMGPEKVSLAVALSNLSTEGDFGRDTLQDVAKTLAEAIRESPAAGN